jgi:hypothetical protein
VPAHGEAVEKGEWREMDVLQTLISDSALLLFSLAGLTATAVAILRDTQAQRADLTQIPIES